MDEHPDGQRLRSLECDRRFASGLFMGAAAILAARVAPAIPAYAAWFEPRGASQIFAPIVALSAMMFALVAALVAAGEERRGIAAATMAAAALLVAAGVPFARQTLLSFIGGATPAWAAAAVAFTTFGLTAGIAIQETGPSPGHAKFSAAITVLALFIAATDGSGVFSAILASLGILFFTLYRVPAEG